MIDKDLALLYGVETKRLVEQVKRNSYRFPDDFMFRLNKEEFSTLRSQNATLEQGKGKHSKYLPLAFTEHGILMLSSVLKSRIAVDINIQIIRIFTNMRKVLMTYEDLYRKISTLEEKR